MMTSSSSYNDNNPERVMSNSAMELSPQFELEIVEGSGVTRGCGEVTCACAANDCVLLGTKKGALVRYDYSDDSELNRTVVQLSKGGEHAVTRLYLDRSSMHAFATLEDNSGASLEYVYVNTVTQAPRLLTKLRGLRIESIGWTDIHSDNRFLRGSGTCTGPMLLGNASGQLYEYSVDDKEKKEKGTPKVLYELEERDRIYGIDFCPLGTHSNKILVVAITSTRCYFFSGASSFESVFASYKDDADSVLSFLELPGQSVYGELHMYRNLKKVPQQLTWMAAPGVFHGQMLLDSEEEAGQSTYHTFLSNNALLDYSSNANSGEGEDQEENQRPLSIAITEYHFLLLFPRSVKVINRISERLVHEELLEGNFRGRPLGLIRDESAQVVYLYSTEGLYSFEVRNESQDIWRLYLEKGDYEQALEYARTVDQRNHIYNKQATRAIGNGNYNAAAKNYANVCGLPSFEEICLKFIEINQFSGLQTFLQEKLRKMNSTERTQATMVSTWLTEIYLDAVNEAYVKHGRNSEEHQEALAHFREFLKTFKRYLDQSTTCWLLSSYGHVDELIHYASMMEDHETVVQNLIQRDRAEEAIQVLRKPSVPSSLWYKASPKLFLLEPHATVDAWIIADKLLDPIKLLPSLLKVTAQEDNSVHSQEAVRYLQCCISRMGNKDCRIHNLLLSFLCQYDQEGPLLKYLTSEGLSPSGESYYDSKFALRLCMKMKKVRCCVQLYSMMHLYEEAVNNALHVDLELAKSVADRPEDDHILRKKLWLVIAQHVIEQDKSDKGENIRKAIAFRKETENLLKVEDILPFFPNFVLIDDFKDAIIQSLEEYNTQIEDLKTEMDEITQGTEALRNDLMMVSKRSVSVPQNGACAKCREPVDMSGNAGAGEYFVFPCGHVFKKKCLQELVSELSPAYVDYPLNSECPYCGDLIVKSVSKPFITDREYEEGEVDSWKLN
jgi:hypothetical protein